MKKLLLLALAVILCFSLVACGEKKQEEVPSFEDNTPEAEVEPQVIMVESEEEDIDEEEVPEVISGEEVMEEESGEIAE